MVRLGREKWGEAPTGLEQKLASVQSDGQKVLLKYGNSKRRVKENRGAVHVGDGHLIKRDKEKGEAGHWLFSLSVINPTSNGRPGAAGPSTSEAGVTFWSRTLRL